MYKKGGGRDQTRNGCGGLNFEIGRGGTAGNHQRRLRAELWRLLLLLHPRVYVCVYIYLFDFKNKTIDEEGNWSKLGIYSSDTRNFDSGILLHLYAGHCAFLFFIFIFCWVKIYIYIYISGCFTAQQ